MEKNIIKGLIFTLVKLNTGIQFYFFYQYIHQDQKKYIYSFVSFYVIERLFSWIIEISALNTKKLESILILILNLAQLEEFYFMVNYKRHSKYLEQGIVGQGVIICLFNIPLYLMSIVWVLKIQYIPLNVAFISIVLILLYIGPFSIVFIIFIGAQQFNIDNFSKIQLWVFQYLYSYFQFFTFFWSLCFIWNYYNFQYYVLVVDSVLITLLINYLWLRFKNNFEACDKYIFLIIIIMKQVLHIVVGYRKKKYLVMNIQKKTGYKVQNSMIVFEFLIKLYLLIAFWIVFQTKKDNQQLYSFQVTILVMLIISFLILLYQSINQVIIKQYIYKEFLELDSVEEFIQLDKNSNDFKHKKIKQIEIFDIFYNQETHGINIIKNILFEYQSIEITGKDFNKKKIKNDQYYYSVEILFVVKAKQILDAIQTKKILPQIQSVQLHLQNDEGLYDLYKFWIDNYIKISLYTNYDHKYSELTIEIKGKMQSSISQLIAYQKNIFLEMIVNPYYIYYDLYD
ncbi:hypothetical protein ABPG72_010067 [Tetrahymena utriculariae]